MGRASAHDHVLERGSGVSATVLRVLKDFISLSVCFLYSSQIRFGRTIHNVGQENHPELGKLCASGP